MNKSNLILAGSGYLGESIIAEYSNIKHTFNIIPIKEILFMCSKIGFKIIKKINMSDCNYDNQYLYIFKKVI